MRTAGQRSGLMPLVLLVVCTGCIGLRDFEVPANLAVSVPSFAGPVSVESVWVDRGGLYHQGFNSGFLGLFEFLFLIEKTRRIPDVIRESGSPDIEEFWRGRIEQRLRASGGFAGGGQPVQVEVEITALQKHLEGQGWVVAAWLLNPVWTLLAGPDGCGRVVADVTFHVSSGSWSQDYEYHYDQSVTFGLYYGRDHRQGSVLGELCDRLVGDLRRDLEGGPDWRRTSQ